MRISRRKPKRKEDKKRYRINEWIRAPQVLVIDEEGNSLGVMETRKALVLAKGKDLDLVEVSPVANPPVAKIMDYSKHKYQEEKEFRKQKARQKKIEIKGIRLSLRISKHDTEFRLNQAEKFLAEDNKVKIEMILKGRERQHQDLAKKIINDFVNSLKSKMEIEIEQPLTIQGRRLSLIISKK